MLPFSQLDVSVPKPIGNGYTKNPQTIGNHLRNRRLTLKLEQTEASERIGVKYKTYITWETEGVVPHPRHFPKIIQFLGYNPIPIDTATVSGRIKACCTLKGVSKLKFSKHLGVDVRLLKRWEEGKTEPDQRIKDEVEFMVWELTSSLNNFNTENP